MPDFMVHLVEEQIRTPIGTLDDLLGAEIFAQVDSTPDEPVASLHKHIEVSLPDGLYSTDVYVRVEGPSASMWEMTQTDPNDPNATVTWVAELTNQTIDYRPMPPIPLTLWLRALTYHQEPADNDRTTHLAVTGRQRAAE